MQNFYSNFSSARTFYKTPSKSRVAFGQKSKRIPFDCKEKFRKELDLKRISLDEKRPTKFATTSWQESQIPYTTYRSLVLIYSISILTWKIYFESNYGNVEKWLLALPTWTFILFTFYNCLLFIFTILQFFHDCLCNDDLSWKWLLVNAGVFIRSFQVLCSELLRYHKLAWVTQSVVCNNSFMCCFGTLVHAFAILSVDIATQERTEIFTSDDPNFTYIIGALMIIEVFVSNITVRLLHVIYPMVFYVVYLTFNIYRWSAGYVPVFQVLDYGNHPGSSIAFIFITTMLVCPILHLLAYAIDMLRSTILLTCIERHRRHFVEVLHGSEGVAASYARAQSSVSTRAQTSSRIYPTNTTSPSTNSSPHKPISAATEQLFCNGRLAFY